MRPNFTRFVLAASLLLLLGASVVGVADERKIKNKIAPVYPELAKRMQVSGTVKLEVTIEPNGSVANVKAIGGHPLLIQAATEAAKNYRFDPAPSVTTQILEFHFNAQ